MRFPNRVTALLGVDIPIVQAPMGYIAKPALVSAVSNAGAMGLVRVLPAEGFRDAVQEAGASTKDGKGMWADSSFEDLVQYNDGFKTQLIGTPEQIAERIVEYKKIGVNLMLTCYLHFQEEVAAFGQDILPIVRELEADLARKHGAELDLSQTPVATAEVAA